MDMAAIDEPRPVLITGASGYYETFNKPRGGLRPPLDMIHKVIYWGTCPERLTATPDAND